MDGPLKNQSIARIFWSKLLLRLQYPYYNIKLNLIPEGLLSRLTSISKWFEKISKSGGGIIELVHSCKALQNRLPDVRFWTGLTGKMAIVWWNNKSKPGHACVTIHLATLHKIMSESSYSHQPINQFSCSINENWFIDWWEMQTLTPWYPIGEYLVEGCNSANKEFDSPESLGGKSEGRMMIRKCEGSDSLKPFLNITFNGHEDVWDSLEGKWCTEDNLSL